MKTKFIEWWEDFQAVHEDWRLTDREAILFAAYQAGFAAAPTPPAHAGMVRVTTEDANNYCRILSLLGMEEEGDPVAEVEKLLSTTPAQEAEPAEPLCWVHEDELPESLPDSVYRELYPYSKVDIVRMFPIFGPRPDTSELRKAAEELLNYCDNNLNEQPTYGLIENLRAALK